MGWTNLLLQDRLSAHISEARRKPHTYRARWINSLLSQGIRPGIRLVEEAEDYAEAERRWIATLHDQGFRLTNGTRGGRGVFGARWTLTPEQLAALKSRRPRPIFPEEREQMRQRAKGNKNWLGRHHSEETKAKLRAYQAESRRQRELRKPPPSPKPPRRPSRRMLGKRHSEETKRRLSQIRQGRKEKPEIVAKRAAALKGHSVSPATRQKISEAQKRRWAKRRADVSSMEPMVKAGS